MEKKCKIYLPYNWMYGDATAFYVDIIADAMKLKGYNTSIVKNTDYITTNDIVVTVTSINVRDVIKRKPKAIVNWYQGIAPEEYFFFLRKKDEGLLQRVKRYILMSLNDNFALRHSD